MKIDKIKKTSKGKYKVVLNNNTSLTTYDDVILNNGLLYNKVLDDDLLMKISIETEYYDIYDKTIKFISRKLRSEYEIDEFLNKHDVPLDSKNKIKEKLKSIGLINDDNFTKAYIYDRFNLSSDGPNKIKKDLINYKIDLNIIENNLFILKEEDIKEKIEKIVSKKIRLDHKHSLSFIKQKIKSDLNNLGYDSDMIESSLQNITLSNNNINKEYETIYNKLVKKYEGKDLEFHIRQKLYQKGYKIEEINEQIKS